MSLDKNLIEVFINITSKAAVECLKFVGKGNKQLADKAATDSMRNNLNKLNIDGKIVIGEGELDEAPMLFIGEKLGTGNGPKIDIAVDPLEGTNFAAKNLPNSIAVMAVAKKGCLLSAPDTYMEKIAIGTGYPKNIVDLDNTVEKNIKLIAEAKDLKPENLTACLLKRSRHDKIISSLVSLNVKIKFIDDGDVTGVISVVDPNSPIDVYLGTGGGPEGVLAAAALHCLGGQMQSRLVIKSDEEIKRAKKLGISNFEKKYTIDDMIKGDVIFCATGVTDGDILNGIIDKGDYFEANSFVLHKNQKIAKKIKNTLKK